MGDLQFIRKHRGTLDDLKVIFVGEVANLCMSWFEAAVKFSISVTQVAPKEYLAGDDMVKELKSHALGRITTSSDLDSMLEKADLIYTDCWPNCDVPEDYEKIKKLFLPFQITDKHLNRLHQDAMFLPCPPVTRGQEVTHEAMNSKFCMNYQAKEYLLHCQNAIAEMIVSEKALNSTKHIT